MARRVLQGAPRALAFREREKAKTENRVTGRVAEEVGLGTQRASLQLRRCIPGTGRPASGGEESRLCSAAGKHPKTPGFVEPRLRLDFGPAPPRDPQPGIQERLAHRGPPMGLSLREPWEQPRGTTPALWFWAGAYPEGGWESTTSPAARKRPRPKAGGPVLGAEAAAELAGFGVRAARTWHRTFRRRRSRCPAPPRCVCWVWMVSGLRVDAKSRRVGSARPKLGASLGAAPG